MESNLHKIERKTTHAESYLFNDCLVARERINKACGERESTLFNKNAEMGVENL